VAKRAGYFKQLHIRTHVSEEKRMSRKRRQIELPNSYVEGRPPEGEPSIPPGYSGPLPPLGNNPHGDWFRDMKSGSKEAKEQQALFNKAPYAMKAADDEAKSEYVTQLALVAQRIELDAQALRQSLGGQPQAHIEVLRQDVNVRNKLVERKTQDLNRHRAAANSYFGSTPFGKSPVEYAVATYRLTVQMRLRPPALEQALKSAYHAAYSAQLDEAEIQILQAQIAALHQAIASAEAQAQAQAEAAARAQAELEAAARAEAHARAQALATAQAKAREAAEKAAAQRALAEQVIRQANTYKAPLSELVAKPAIVMATAAAPALQGGVELATAIRTAVLSLGVASIKAVSGSFLAGTFALLYSPKLGNGELQDNYILSTPLTDLNVELDAAAQAAAVERGAIDLPVRMGDKREQIGPTELFAVRTDGAVISSVVPVLAAEFNAQNGQYIVTTDDLPPRTLIWTPAVEPSDSSTTLPATPPHATAMVGPTLEPLEGRIDAYPDLPDVGLDDYVIIFPADSGLPPLYVMFKSPRNLPGVVSGKGQLIQGEFLYDGNREGAPIPAQIASKLRGKKFSSFGAFRRRLWQLIGRSPLFEKQFTLADLLAMRRGLAPVAQKSEQVGSRRKFEIHHMTSIHNGGAVYDVENMLILAPKFHIEAHQKNEL
jgi:hypothetical protein